MSPNLFFHFRFGQIWSESKTLQIFLESFCVYSSAHASSYFSYASFLGMPSLTSLKPSYLHCGIYPFLSMLPLRSSSLAHRNSLPPNDLVVWTDGSVPFPVGKGGSSVLANCSLSGTAATLSVSAGPFFQVPLKPAPFCKLAPGLGSTNKSATSLFLLSDSRSVLSSIFSFTSNSLAETAFSFPLYNHAKVGPRTLVSPGKRHGRPELARRGVLLLPFAIPCSLSRLISRIHSFLFPDRRRIARFPRFLLMNFCSLVTFAVSSLVFAATYTAFC